jgi:hypothetical protein
MRGLGHKTCRYTRNRFSLDDRVISNTRVINPALSAISYVAQSVISISVVSDIFLFCLPHCRSSVCSALVRVEVTLYMTLGVEILHDKAAKFWMLIFFLDISLRLLIYQFSVPLLCFFMLYSLVPAHTDLQGSMGWG